MLTQDSLRAIAADGYSVPAGCDLATLTRELAGLLGSPVSALREGALEILWHWGEAGRYSDAELRALGEQMAANLSVGLGEFETDTVFLRSFSALILEMVVLADLVRSADADAGKPPLLTEREVRDWFERALAAFSGEVDFRGCTEAKGWAHSLAHLSDLLGALARSPHLERPHLERILSAVADKLVVPAPVVLLFEEDHRMIRGAVMHSLLRNELAPEFLTAWVATLARRPDGSSWGTVFGEDACDEAGNRARVNVRSFLRALYFVLTWGMTVAPYPSLAGKAFSAYYERPIAARDVLLADITRALKGMNRPMFRADS